MIHKKRKRWKKELSQERFKKKESTKEIEIDQGKRKRKITQ